ncbi:MAG: D-lactate dehydrogenase [Pseudomonadota bacterium]|uniref:Quinone-dependent D-lactate dehydrogenase n=1 Tax=Alteromonas alba TaxID=2079529 RepID=A0A2S9VC81_9ALTE|nr:D-lactate dehydrogenase [Alteromonas alba]MAJ71047.1 D-lactate dehydrogenase [Alteromonadaceae bacterium]MCP4866046.1 D-lactate dehydrogenase [Alteromonas sp.]MDY6926519.1 D-lactate dehydrogenase [Pseudomonadota bacterium]RPH17877.1 MAG: D-lactate dehydrogenase [Alteromonadaceae bacterium TMED7]PRO74067.1 D-lactate dehydrogenase [Alteromonas alba]|tara:strand:- start:1134 stop:2834 length:1701 start_codon:yes stop_codon:yes gene_type:complete
MSHSPILSQFIQLLGEDKVATGDRRTEHYRSGWRSGSGTALAVLFPDTLLSLWQTLQICVDNNCIIIMQAAKTGLTEGSTPSGDDYDREVVVINTLAMDNLVVLGNGEQVLSFPGTTLHKLETTLKPLHRAPHSVIGSSCLGASIVGGVANNSGGALVKRGPAYTELALFAQVTAEGKLELVNHLDIELGDTPQEILTNLASGNFDHTTTASDKKASASDYTERLRDVDADTPSRFNADTSRLYEASGCAGKLAVFAVRLDTFEVAKQEKTFYIGTNNPDTLTRLRRHILAEFNYLPEVGEYIHRDIFDIAAKYGKDTFLSVKHLGTDRLPKMFALKGRIDALLNKVSFVPDFLTDRLMQGVSGLLREHLPDRMLEYREKYEHHLILKMSDEGIAEAQAFLPAFFDNNEQVGGFFECTERESGSAFLHRFAAAGAAVRYQLLHQKEVGDILALDIALRRNEHDWVEKLPESLTDKIDKSLYYGHFFCHVFHQDYVLKKGVNAKEVKAEMLRILDSRGAKYPAEHNVGHLYQAEEGLAAFYQRIDPTNTFNPGVGKLEKHKRNCSCC